jgi:hypothetical protein
MRAASNEKVLHSSSKLVNNASSAKDNECKAMMQWLFHARSTAIHSVVQDNKNLNNFLGE